MAAEAQPAQRSTLEREWWLRSLAVFQSPRAVFAALRSESDEQAEARQEPILALVFLAGIAGSLASPTMGRLLDDPAIDGVLVAVLAFLAGGMYGFAGYWLGGAAVYAGARGAGGTGSYRRARHLLAYAAAPLALSLALMWPLKLAVYGGDAFRGGGSDASGADSWFFSGLEAVFVLWGLGLLVLGLATVHRWRLWRSLGAIALGIFAFLSLAVAVIILLPR